MEQQARISNHRGVHWHWEAGSNSYSSYCLDQGLTDSHAMLGQGLP
jgi:hypothetical protein